MRFIFAYLFYFSKYIHIHDFISSHLFCKVGRKLASLSSLSVRKLRLGEVSGVCKDIKVVKSLIQSRVWFFWLQNQDIFLNGPCTLNEHEELLKIRMFILTILVQYFRQSLQMMAPETIHPNPHMFCMSHQPKFMWPSRSWISSKAFGSKFSLLSMTRGYLHTCPRSLSDSFENTGCPMSLPGA